MNRCNIINIDSLVKNTPSQRSERKPRKLGWELTIGEITKFGVTCYLIKVLVLQVLFILMSKHLLISYVFHYCSFFRILSKSFFQMTFYPDFHSTRFSIPFLKTFHDFFRFSLSTLAISCYLCMYS